MKICQTITNLKNLLCCVEKDFESYKILIMYGQIASRHNDCKFAFCKQCVKIAVFNELQYKYYILKSINIPYVSFDTIKTYRKVLAYLI